MAATTASVAYAVVSNGTYLAPHILLLALFGVKQKPVPATAAAATAADDAHAGLL